jgi:hypothetical protein
VENTRLGAGDWGTKACRPTRPSITYSICPGAQESLPTLKKDSFLTERSGNVDENKGPEKLDSVSWIQESGKNHKRIP